MKRKPVPLLKIGIFVLVGFILLIVFIFYLGNKEKMFSSTSEIKSRFATVSSLKKGAEVDMAGINVGSVKSIELPRNSRDSVTVTMKIVTDALKLIHTDSKASITTQGIIGDKVIFISMGGDSTQAVTPGSTIGGLGSPDYSRIYDTLVAVVSQLDSVAVAATQLIQKLHSGNGTLAKLVNDDGLYNNANAAASAVRSTLEHANGAMEKMSGGVDSFTHQMSDIINRVNRGEGSLGKLLTKEDIYDNVRKTSENLISSTDALHDALAKIALASGRAAEVTEAFKHNFLVKGYFEDRGYWDAPEFEMTIDRKLDSLKRIQRAIQEQKEHAPH